MHYKLFFRQPTRHLIDIELYLPASVEAQTTVQTPRWRPGRYELQYYQDNICDVAAFRELDTPVQVDKTGMDTWVVDMSHGQPVRLSYRYYANFNDAGGSYYDEYMVYLNLINLLLYRPADMHEPVEIALDLPQHFTVACQLPVINGTLHAINYHEAFDTPLIASKTLQHEAYTAGGHTFHVWFQGDVRPEWKNILHDFSHFSEQQVKLFGEAPFGDYHFLFHILNHKMHHGVEHQASTIIVLGPSHKLMKGEAYDDFLAISSHELFHAWNVKALRPKDMQPYDYTRPQYSEMHYVTEGVTTYYGDLMLLKSGVWSLRKYLETFNQQELFRHFTNGSNAHISLARSSFDSWNNGYSAGIPNRKISFYTKGSIVAFMLDMAIRRETAHARSLDNVMRLMYQRYGRTGMGYTRIQYLETIAEVSGSDFSGFFERFIEGTEPVQDELARAGEEIGLDMHTQDLGAAPETLFGFFIDEESGNSIIAKVLEGSPADKCGLSKDDIVIAINGLRARTTVAELMVHFSDEPALDVHVFRQHRLLQLRLIREPEYRNRWYYLAPASHASEQQLERRSRWMSVTLP